MPTEFINRVEASCGSSGDKIKRCRERLRNSPSLAVVYASMCGMGCLAAPSLSEPDRRLARPLLAGRLADRPRPSARKMRNMVMFAPSLISDDGCVERETVRRRVPTQRRRRGIPLRKIVLDDGETLRFL